MLLTSSYPTFTSGDAMIDQNGFISMNDGNQQSNDDQNKIVIQPNQEQFLSISLRSEKVLLHRIPLIPIDCSFGYVTEKVFDPMTFHKMLQYEHKKLGFGCINSSTHKKKMKKSRQKLPPVTVVFAIRRPGCGGCREHGLQITELLNSMKKENPNYQICTMGIIKETDVAINGSLLDFYNQFYRYPIYKDTNWSIFTKILGNRKISVWKLISMIPTLERRYASKSIINIPFGGDIFTQGGILILDQYHKIRHIHYENYSELFNMNEIKTSILSAMKHNEEM